MGSFDGTPGRDEMVAMMRARDETIARLRTQLAETQAGLREAHEAWLENQRAWEAGLERPARCPDPECDAYMGPDSNDEHARECRYTALRELAGVDGG